MATTPTQTGSAAELSRRLIDAVSRQDFATLRQFWTEDTVDDFVALGIEVRGPDALEAFFRQMHDAFPDFSMTVVRTIAEGDTAVSEWRITGTFTGAPFNGIHPTGKAIELRGVDIMEFRDGKLGRNTVIYDAATFARQVGMLPPVDSAGEKAMTAAFNAVTDVKARFKKN